MQGLQMPVGWALCLTLFDVAGLTSGAELASAGVVLSLTSVTCKRFHSMGEHRRVRPGHETASCLTSHLLPSKTQTITTTAMAPIYLPGPLPSEVPLGRETGDGPAGGSDESDIPRQQRCQCRRRPFGGLGPLTWCHNTTRSWTGRRPKGE